MTCLTGLYLVSSLYGRFDKILGVHDPFSIGSIQLFDCLTRVQKCDRAYSQHIFQGEDLGDEDSEDEVDEEYDDYYDDEEEEGGKGRKKKKPSHGGFIIDEAGIHFYHYFSISQSSQCSTGGYGAEFLINQDLWMEMTQDRIQCTTSRLKL